MTKEVVAKIFNKDCDDCVKQKVKPQPCGRKGVDDEVCPYQEFKTGQVFSALSSQPKNLKEEIAITIGEYRYRDSFYGEYVTENDRNELREEASKVLSLIQVRHEAELEQWLDIPDKVGDWWMSAHIRDNGKKFYTEPRILHVLDFHRPDRGLEVEYETGARSSVPVKEFITEWYPESKWLYIPIPNWQSLKEDKHD